MSTVMVKQQANNSLSTNIGFVLRLNNNNIFTFISLCQRNVSLFKLLATINQTHKHSFKINTITFGERTIKYPYLLVRL